MFSSSTKYFLFDTFFKKEEGNIILIFYVDYIFANSKNSIIQKQYLHFYIFKSFNKILIKLFFLQKRDTYILLLTKNLNSNFFLHNT